MPYHRPCSPRPRKRGALHDVPRLGGPEHHSISSACVPEITILARCSQASPSPSTRFFPALRMKHLFLSA
jgi:hypothetical protein